MCSPNPLNNISETTIQENIYLQSNKANYEWLMESKAQLEHGQVAMYELDEADV